MDLTWKKKKKKGPITWAKKANAAFEEIEMLCAVDTMFHYLDFNK